ncbi:hypothetical protein [Baekduia sp. Peel2402]|uniref:hypothetical protein n=1 Tax=Baekduia sp. Peel2402 TaxID=3458296 RepID=UPI00403E50B2
MSRVPEAFVAPVGFLNDPGVVPSVTHKVVPVDWSTEKQVASATPLVVAGGPAVQLAAVTV